MKTTVAEFIGTIRNAGAETMTANYASAIDKDRFRMIVIVLRRTHNSADAALCQQNGVEIVPLFKNDSFFAKILQKLNYWWLIPYKLASILEKENVQVLHVHMALLHYVKRLKKAHPRIVYSVHTDPTVFFAKNPKEKDAVEYFAKHHNIQVLALHEQMKSELQKILSLDNIQVLRNGIYLDRYGKVSKEEARAKLGIPEDAFVLGHVGRFVEVKNHEFIVDIFSSVYEENKRAFLVLAGDGKLKENIKKSLRQKGLSDHTLILSDRDDIPEILPAMDVFLFPSKYEGLGMALIEAQAAGLKCVVSENIPKDAYRSDKVVTASLETGVDGWKKSIFSNLDYSTEYGPLDEYDIYKEVLKLQDLYEGLG